MCLTVNKPAKTKLSSTHGNDCFSQENERSVHGNELYLRLGVSNTVLVDLYGSCLNS